jgi:hypothetical protein
MFPGLALQQVIEKRREFNLLTSVHSQIMRMLATV